MKRDKPFVTVSEVEQTAPGPGIRLIGGERAHWVRDGIRSGWVRVRWPVEPDQSTITFEEPWVFEPSRATTALDLRDMHGAWVDAAVGEVEPTVDLWEYGVEIPTEEQVRRLATLTRFRPSWFYMPPILADSAFACRQ